MNPGDQERRSALLARINRIPIVATLGLEIVRFGDGTCESRVPRRRNYDGVFESFHGGLLMTVADSTACFAILTRTGPDTRLTTTDMNIRFLAACLTDVTRQLFTSVSVIHTIIRKLEIAIQRPVNSEVPLCQTNQRIPSFESTATCT